MSQHVLIQTPLPPPLKLFTTHLAAEEGGVVGELLVDLLVLLVSLPAELTLEPPRTQLTLERHLIRVNLGLVSLHLDPLLEPLVTLTAFILQIMTRGLLMEK